MFRGNRGFTNGYEQRRPYVVYVMGPHQDTVELFFGNLRRRITNHPGIDRVVCSDSERDVPISNEFRVLHGARDRNHVSVEYRIVRDSSLLHADPIGAMPEIDAYILVFRLSSAEDFVALRDRQVHRIVQLCTRTWRPELPKKVLYLVGHKLSIFHSKPEFDVDELTRLLANSHASYVHRCLDVGEQCCNVMELVIKRLNDVHTRHQLDEKTRKIREVHQQSEQQNGAVDFISSFIGNLRCAPQGESDPETIDSGWLVVHEFTPMGAPV